MEKQEYLTIAQNALSEAFDFFADDLVNEPLKEALYLEKDKVVNRWAKKALAEWEPKEGTSEADVRLKKALDEWGPKEGTSEADVRLTLSRRVAPRFSKALSRLSSEILDKNREVAEADEALEILHSRIRHVINDVLNDLNGEDKELMRGIFNTQAQYVRISKEFFAKTEAPYTAEKAEHYPFTDDLLDRMEEAYRENIDKAMLILRDKAADGARRFDLPSDWQDVLANYRPMTLNAFLDTHQQIEDDLPEFVRGLQY